MRIFSREMAALAMFSCALAGCASPHYPTREGYGAGPPPLTLPKPKYSTDEAAQTAPAASPTPAPAAAANADAQPQGPLTAVPVAQVESQPLPPPTPVAATAQSAAAPSDAVAQDTAPASPPAAAAPPVSSTSDQPLAPRQVIHDETPSAPPPASPPPPAREAMASEPAPRRTVETTTTISGRVVEASDIFENYEVQKGDHVDALARAFNTSRKVLLDANDLKAPYRLRPGQILKVPVAKAYVVERGDTLNGVAKRFGVEAGELADLNHISTHASLRAGQEIGLPSSMHDRGPLRSSTTTREYAEGGPPPERPAYVPDRPAPDLETPLPSHQGLTPMTPSEGAPTQLHAPPAPEYHAIPPGGGAPQAAGGLSDAAVAAAAHGRFVWPTHGDIVTRFGPQGVGRRNDGVDIRAPQGQPVLAAAGGEVVYSGNLVPGYGNLVLIKHADGWVTAYAHLDKLEVHMKDEVSQGQEIGQVGMTGDATAPGLHFEVRYAPAPGAKTQPVDPVLVLPAG
jgi:murein DD-endopeptidase MepM/ murein hydrolase activator NlpD